VVGKIGAAMEKNAINVLGKSRNSTMILKPKISASIFKHLKEENCFLSFFLSGMAQLNHCSKGVVST